MMINPRVLILVVAMSAALNVASQDQVECNEKQLDMQNFLNVASRDAVEFEYLNCTTDEMADYVGTANKGEQTARFFLDGGYVIITEGRVNPIYDQEEKYKDISLMLQGEYCWACINGLTLYGHVDRVKKAVDHYKSGNTLASYVKQNGMERVQDADYLWLVKGGYCPYSHQLKMFWAYYEQGKYEFYGVDKGEEQATKNSFDRFYQVINAKKYEKRTVKIDANLGNKKIDIEVV